MHALVQHLKHKYLIHECFIYVLMYILVGICLNMPSLPKTFVIVLNWKNLKTIVLLINTLACQLSNSYFIFIREE
jgi:hypothetical protein